MNRTNLYDSHVKLGARMVPFAGWEMPVQYTGPLEEHAIVRSAVGVFDIDHMGQVIVEGPEALEFLQSMVVSDVAQLGMWEASYSLLCYADGGTVDDIFIYRLPEYYYVVVNASNLKKDVRWLEAHAPGFGVQIRDVSVETYMLALQGPSAQDILQTVCDIDLRKIGFHTCARGRVVGVDAIIGATGYTGEYGYELFFDASHVVKVWDTLLATGARPIGLAARDSLRFEPCLPLYGHELGPDISPLEAGLGLFVKTEKGDFVGRDTLLKQRLEGVPRKLVCLEMLDKGVPREHYEVVVEGEYGHVTTGMFAPTLETYAAMALIPAHLAEVGREVEVIIREKPKRAKIVKRPFYIPAYRR